MNVVALVLPLVVFVALAVGAVAFHRAYRRRLLGEDTRDSSSEVERFRRRMGGPNASGGRSRGESTPSTEPKRLDGR